MAQRLPNPDQICARIAAAQYGLVSRQEALEAGFSLAAIRRRVANGTFAQILPGVYALPGSVPSYERQVMAAVLWAGPGSASSYRCAGSLRRWERVPKGFVEISCVRTLAPRVGIASHRFPVETPGGLILHPDWSYPDKKVAIECESYIYHSGRKMWLKDIDRRKILRRLTWNVIEVVEETLEGKLLTEFITDLRTALRG